LGALLAAPADTIALCGSDSIGMAWLADALTVNSIVLSTHEPPAAAAPWLALARERKLPLRFFEPKFDPERDRDAVSGHVQSGGVLVVSHAAATTGQELAIGPLAEAAHARGGLVIVYGSTAAGVIPADVTALGVDAYVGSGHAWLLGPIGTAFVYARPELLPRLAPRQGPVDLHAWPQVVWPPKLRRGRDLEAIPVSAAHAAGLHASIEWFSGMGLDAMRAQTLGLAQHLHAALSGVQGIEVLTPAASVQTSPIVTFRVTKRPNTQVASWLLERHRVRLHRLDVRRMNAVRASPSLVTRVADIDAMLEGVRALAL
jgi:selenocysteine lyase/cysteine desulfurase